MNSILEQVRLGRPVDVDVIDMHAHLGRYKFAVPDTSAQSVVDSMDRLGIRSVACCPMGASGPYVDEGNAEVLAAMRAHPGRIMGYVGLFPSDADEVRKVTERWLAEGFIGLKVHNSNRIPYTDAAYSPAYGIADERRLPILLHTWGAAEEFEQIRKLSAGYPNAVFLVAHAGSENEHRYVEVARDCANVYLELACSYAPRGMVARLVEAVGADRIVWGTDVYFFDQAEQFGKVAGADIPEQAKRQILGGNAQRILDGIQTG